jgi:predicted transcriptional regulator
MNAEGWRTVEQVMETSKLSNARIYNMIREGLFEREKKKVKTGGMIKVLNFVRPKV